MQVAKVFFFSQAHDGLVYELLVFFLSLAVRQRPEVVLSSFVSTKYIASEVLIKKNP